MASCLGRDRRWTIAGLVAVFCCATAPAWAQTALGGIIRDPGGYVVPYATVVVVEETTGQTSKVVSAPFGHYIFPDLPAGRYRISVEVREDTTLLKFNATGVLVTAGYLNAYDIRLTVASEERLTVQSETSPVSTSIETSIDGTTRFTRAAIDAMPLSNGRTLQSMLSVVPGVVFTENNSSPAQFTAAGQRRLSNRMTIDGVSADLAAAVTLGIDEASAGVLPAFPTSGGTQTLVPMEAIDEIEVRTTNSTAEHARAPGAQTSVVTRSGTDRFAASAFAEARPSRLAASDWFTNAGTSPERRTDLWDTGASVGGPLYPRRIFYFGTWQRQQIDREVIATIPVPSLAVREAASHRVRPLLDAYPLPNGSELEEGLAEFSHTFPAPSRLSVVSLRVDANLSREHRLFARINGGGSSGNILAAGGQLQAASFTQAESTSTRTTTVGLTSVAPSLTHEFRVNASSHWGSLTAGPAPYGGAQALPLALLVAPDRSEASASVALALFAGPEGLVALGHTGTSAQEQIEIVDTWSSVRGRHHWRMGFDYRQMTVSTKRAPDRYTYRFNEIGQVMQGRVTSVTLEHIAPARARLQRWSMFAQDTVRLSPRLTVDYGLRYSVGPPPASLTELNPLLVQFETLPQVRPRPDGARLWKTSWTDVAPQAAATYQVGRTAGYEAILRAGWSLVFDDGIGPGMGAFGGGPPYVSRRIIGASMFPLAPDVLSMPLPTPLSPGNLADSYAFPEDFRTPHTYDWQVGFDQALGRFQRLGLAYVGAAGRDLPYWHAYWVDPLRPPTPRVHAFSRDGESNYHALLLEYIRHPSHGFSGRVAYTWSHAIDVGSGERVTGPNAPPSLISPAFNRASADFDRRHVMQAIGSYRPAMSRLPRLLQGLGADWQVDVVVTARSGAPVSITSTRSLGGIGLYSLRPDSVPDVPVWIVDSTSPSGRRINPAAFAVPPEPRQGSLGRNTLRSAALHQVDLAMSRAIRLGRRVVAQLRLDAFNVFNVPNFGPPSALLGVTPFGEPDSSYADALGTGTLALGGLAPVQQVGGPRSLQLGVRLSY